MDITVSKINKSFDGRPVLTDFSAQFPAGEISCIMGRSGCGKTTLLNIILGLLRPDSGEVKGVPKKMSCIFQEDRLCGDFSAVANVRIACPQKTDKAEIEAQLSSIGLGDSLYRPVRDLSGGMKRRVAIVRAMMAESELVIMDEPFKGLDEATKLLAVHFVKNGIRGKTAIMVTHEENEIELMGGQLIKLSEV